MLCVCYRVLRADGVCESVLYGLPLVIRPTTCWQLDWEEMEANHNLFHALCHTLRVCDSQLPQKELVKHLTTRKLMHLLWLSKLRPHCFCYSCIYSHPGLFWQFHDVLSHTANLCVCLHHINQVVGLRLDGISHICSVGCRLQELGEQTSGRAGSSRKNI